MEKIKREGVKLAVFSLAAAVCFICANFYYQKAGILRWNVNLLVSGDRITTEQACFIRSMELERDEATEFTFWTMAGEAYIEDREQIRSTATNVIEINGSSELLLLSGAVLCEQDRKGCLLGTKTARQLFGSADAAGEQILYKGRLFTVRGILWEIDQCMIVQAKDDTLFERVTLAGKSSVTKTMQAERFCLNYGIEAKLLRSEFLSGDLLREAAPAKWSEFEELSNNLEKYRTQVAAFNSCEKSCLEQQQLHWKKSGEMLACGGLIFSLLGILTGKNFFFQIPLIRIKESCNMI